MKKAKLFNPSSFICIYTVIFFVGCSSTNTGGDNIMDEGLLAIPNFVCEDGLAAGRYPCHNVDLVAHLTPAELLGERLSDIWGWSDPETGKKYALVALTDRITFVDISTPDEPVVIGTLPEPVNDAQGSVFYGNTVQHDDEGNKSTWRDIKVYQNHAFIVSDGQPHGLQVFDLKRLRGVTDPPVTFSEDVHYTEFKNAHNIAVNEESGYAYAVGSDRVGGGLYILDIRQPLQPALSGFYADSSAGYPRTQPDGSRDSTGYVHDTQCVIYKGPDVGYSDREICFSSGETALVIADVTDKSQPQTIGISDYEGREYAHQGWLTEDHQYFLMDDELDEKNGNKNTTTYIWDVRDLDSPRLIGTHVSGTTAIDHNQYVKGNHVYQANYTSGLRILNLDKIAEGALDEVAFFDTFPADDRPAFAGAWSNYPFFDSGIVVVSDISGGLFILAPKF